jgi:phospholipase C
VPFGPPGTIIASTLGVGLKSLHKEEDTMVSRSLTRHALGAALFVAVSMLIASPACADGDLNKVNHIIIMTQENHSFDNYFGALPYAKGTPYHASKAPKGSTVVVCKPKDHKCVDGLTCKKKKGIVTCSNSNPDPGGNPVLAFHQTNYCPGPDLEHSWAGTHREANFANPAVPSASSPNDGFVRVNAETQGPNQAQPPFDTMGYYNEVDLPFYYFLAQNFAINDRYFSGTLGQSFPNHSYALAATSFGHLQTGESLLGPPNYYKPITRSIFDLLDDNNVKWADYYSDYAAWSLLFQPPSERQKPISQFAIDAAAGTLPAVVIVSGSLAPDYDIDGTKYETDEHPPFDIRAGQYYVWQNVMALRNSPSWNDSIVFILHDDPGGFYDHVSPPLAVQEDQFGIPQSTPDGIAPGQCADLSNPPASTLPGGGFNCTKSATIDAPALCPLFTPTGPYPSDCPTFDQLGFRVPFIAVSPFAKKKYVSHTVGDHASLLALIEKRFLPAGAHLNDRDGNANDLEDMFDFKKSPSLKTKLTVAAQQPVQPDTAHNCPFVPTSDLVARSDDDD